MIDKRRNLDSDQSKQFQLQDGSTSLTVKNDPKDNTTTQNLDSELKTRDQKIQAYSSENDVQTQTPVPNENGFCDKQCPFIMTGQFCGPFCRFTPN